MARAKKRKRITPRRLHQEPIVREVARLLDRGVPTKFRWSSAAHHGVRAALCLKGEKWHRADALAASIVELALHRIGSSRRPSWREGQPEPREVEYWYCASCGGFMEDAPSRPWCSDECRKAINEEQRHRMGGREEESKERAVRAVLTGCADRPKAQLERVCRACGKPFRTSLAERRQIYCSRSCSAKRPKYLSRPCLVCASDFTPHQHKQLICGRTACVSEMNNRRVHERTARRVKRSYEKTCIVCGQAFVARRLTAVLCGSDDCLRERRRAQAREHEERKAAATADVSAGDAPMPLRAAA